MFDNFENFFNLSVKDNRDVTTDEISVFRKKYHGMSFGNGIYRVFNDNDIEKWKKIITEGYPDFENCFEPFAYDWLGRCFAIDLRNDAKDKILMFEIGTADVLEIPCSFIGFHEEEIPLYPDACLASNFFNEWREENGIDLRPDKCAGYKIPLFLGGNDTAENLEISDMEVYWYICSSAKNKR